MNPKLPAHVLTQNLLWRLSIVLVTIFFLALPAAELGNDTDRTCVWQPGVIILNIHHALAAQELKHQLLNHAVVDGVRSINEIETAPAKDWGFIFWRHFDVQVSLDSPTDHVVATTARITSVSIVVLPMPFLAFVIALSRLPIPRSRGGIPPRLFGSAALYRMTRIAVLTLITLPVFFGLYLMLAPHYVS